MTRTLGGLVDVQTLMQAMREEQLLAAPADLRPPPVAFPDLEVALALDALEGRVLLEVFDLVHPHDFTVPGLGALWSCLHGAGEAGSIPTPEDLADGLAEHYGVSAERVLALVRRIAASPLVVVPSVRDRAVLVRDVARLRRAFADVEAINLEARATAHTGGALDVPRLLARLRAALDTP